MSEETKLIQQSRRWANWSVNMLLIFLFCAFITAIAALTEDCHWENPTGNEKIRKCTSFLDYLGEELWVSVLVISLFLCLISLSVAFGYWLTDRAKKINESAKNHAKEMKKARRRKKKLMADEREQARDYDSAIKIWEEMGEINEAARVRKLKTEQSTVKVDQTVVHGDYVDDRDTTTTYIDDRNTIIKDSVVSRSNIGAGGDDKFARLEKLTEMKDKGLIDDTEFKQMKKEILGK